MENFQVDGGPFEVIRWPDEMLPSRSPIHFTNDLEVTVPIETIWSMLVDTTQWPNFYPSVKAVDVLDGGAELGLGTRFATNFAGQDMSCRVEEFEPMKRLAWYAYPKASAESRAYHAWILVPSAKGTYIWTEETMQGPLWIEGAKKDPGIFWRTHEKLLSALDVAALERGGVF